MKHLSRHVAVFLVLLLVPSALSASASTRSKKKTKDTKEKEVNICDRQENNSPVECSCKDTQLRTAKDANCWIFIDIQPEDINWHYFASQPNIEKLSFMIRGTGSLKYIPSAVLKQLKNVYHFTIQYGTISELKENIFSNYSSIAEINLSRGFIAILRKHAFDDMKNLTTINLAENRIAEINRDVFVNLPKLGQLLLNSNNITIVHDKAFKHLTNLRELELNGNQIAVITRDTFNGLKSLTRLSLRNNQLLMLGDRNFIEMQELSELELDQNHIRFISEKAFEGMNNLRKLVLSENELVTLEPDFLVGTPNLNFLNLRHNKLKTVTFDNVKPIVTNLYNVTSYFYLDGNKLFCDCKLAWIWGLRNETNNTRLKESLEELTCFFETNNDTLTSAEGTPMQDEQFQQNHGEYLADNFTDDNYSYNPESWQEDEADSNDYYDNYDDESYTDTQPKIEFLEGKRGYFRNLFQLKLEDLPCLEPSREDLMASEEPSGHYKSTLVKSSDSISYMSTSKGISSKYSLLVLSLTYLAIVFT